jgi:hypothetical protein
MLTIAGRYFARLGGEKENMPVANTWDCMRSRVVHDTMLNGQTDRACDRKDKPCLRHS